MTGIAGPLLLSYRTLGLGDLLTAVPALRALRDAFPGHHHVLAAPRWLGPLVATIEAVDEHLATDELATPSLDAPVDVAVNLHGRGPESHRALAELAPRRLIAFRQAAVPAAADAAACWVDDEHEVERWCRLLEGVGIPAQLCRLDLRAPEGLVPTRALGATLIHPGAKTRARRWPPERFAEVARHERAEGRMVVVTGSADEEPLAREVVRAAGLEDGSVLAGQLDISGLARVVAAAGQVVCGDTGVGHLATALGTPSVLLFGPTSPDIWGPPAARRDRHRVLWAGRTGDALSDEPDPGLLQLGVADVVDALDRLRSSSARVPG